MDFNEDESDHDEETIIPGTQEDLLPAADVDVPTGGSATARRSVTAPQSRASLLRVYKPKPWIELTRARSSGHTHRVSVGASGAVRIGKTRDSKRRCCFRWSMTWTTGIG